MITLTFDTDVLRDYLDPSREHHTLAEDLVRLDQERICEIRLITRFTADVPQGHLRDRLDKLEICQRPRIGTFAQWDVSEWDADFWASDEDEEIYSKMFDLIFPGADPDNKRHKSRIADIGHLIGHMHSKKRYLCYPRQGDPWPSTGSAVGVGISVMAPDETLKRCSPK